MPEYNATASATLMVLGEDLEPETVTRAIGLFPNQSWRAGEKPIVRKPNGAPIAIERATEWGCWKAIIPAHFEKEPLERQLAHWKVLLEPRRASLADLTALGWEIVIDCYFATASGELVELDADTMRFFGDLRVSIDIHFFAAPDVSRATVLVTC